MEGKGSESEAAIVQAEEFCLFMSEEVKVVIENAAHIWVGVERGEIISDKSPVYRGWGCPPNRRLMKSILISKQFYSYYGLM